MAQDFHSDRGFDMNGRWDRALIWTPRVLCILFAAFISIFALDVFSEGRGFWTTIAALGMHLIPTAIVVLVTIAAWRFPLVGTFAFLATGLLYIFTFGVRVPSAIPLIAGPQFAIAILFLLGWLRRRRVGQPA
jgi:hypothetical protein